MLDAGHDTPQPPAAKEMDEREGGPSVSQGEVRQQQSLQPGVNRLVGSRGSRREAEFKERSIWRMQVDMVVCGSNGG